MGPYKDMQVIRVRRKAPSGYTVLKYLRQLHGMAQESEEDAAEYLDFLFRTWPKLVAAMKEKVENNHRTGHGWLAAVTLHNLLSLY